MLVGEVEDLRKMMESLKRMVTGQGLEEKRGETGDQEASLEEAEEKEKEKSVGEKTRKNSSTDNKETSYSRRRRKQGLDKSSCQESYQCLVTG